MEIYRKIASSFYVKFVCTKFTNLAWYVSLDKTRVQHAPQLNLVLLSSDIQSIYFSTYVATHFDVTSFLFCL